MSDPGLDLYNLGMSDKLCQYFSVVWFKRVAQWKSWEALNRVIAVLNKKCLDFHCVFIHNQTNYVNQNMNHNNIRVSMTNIHYKNNYRKQLMSCSNWLIDYCFWLYICALFRLNREIPPCFSIHPMGSFRWQDHRYHWACNIFIPSEVQTHNLPIMKLTLYHVATSRGKCPLMLKLQTQQSNM